MALYLALDVGGTKTDYLLADEEQVLARTRSGSIKRMRTDAGRASLYLDTALAALAAESGVSVSEVGYTCVGTAGNTVPLVTDWLRHELQARVPGELQITGDVDIALDAVFPGEPGLLVLAGTGSNVAGRGPDGRVLTTGGWGPALSDQGSGFRIGQQALRAAALAHDAQRPTVLLEAIYAFWTLRSFEDLVECANAAPAPDVSQLVPVVVRCAEQGDAVAQDILQAQGEELAVLVVVLLERLRAQTSADFLPALAFAGSIMENVPAVRRALVGAVRQRFPGIRELPGVVDPTLGALWRARRMGEHKAHTSSGVQR